jgi:hypothetical protein
MYQKIKFFYFSVLYEGGNKILRLLKGPKHEIFVAEFFTQFKPVWVANLGTRK